MSRARDIFRLNLQRCGAYIIDGERLNSRSIYRSAQLYSMLFLPQTPLLGGASPRCGNRRSHPPLNTNPKPPASGLKGGTDVTEWMTILPQAKKNVGTKRTLLRRGTPDGIRTHDLQSRSLTLYPAELRARIQLVYYSASARESKLFSCPIISSRPPPAALWARSRA